MINGLAFPAASGPPVRWRSRAPAAPSAQKRCSSNSRLAEDDLHDLDGAHRQKLESVSAISTSSNGIIRDLDVGSRSSNLLSNSLSAHHHKTQLESKPASSSHSHTPTSRQHTTQGASIARVQVEGGLTYQRPAHILSRSVAAVGARQTESTVTSCRTLPVATGPKALVDLQDNGSPRYQHPVDEHDTTHIKWPLRPRAMASYSYPASLSSDVSTPRSSSPSSTSSGRSSASSISTKRMSQSLVRRQTGLNPMSNVDIATLEERMKMAQLDQLRGYAQDHYGEIKQLTRTEYVPKNMAAGYQVLREPIWNKGE